MSVMSDARLPIPPVLVKNLENVINADLRHVFQNGAVNISRLTQLAEDSLKWEVELDTTTIGFAASQKLHQLLSELKYDDLGIRQLDSMIQVFEVMKTLDIEPDLVEFQNEYFSQSKRLLENTDLLRFKQQSAKLEWIKRFLEIGKFVQVKLPARMEALV